MLVADLDLDQRRDWLELFPFLLTRRPDSYAALTAPVDAGRPYGAGHARDSRHQMTPLRTSLGVGSRW